MPTAVRALGAEGEDLAARWYEDHGYEVLERNWRRREGEVDLIVRQGKTVVFCEVKTRTTDRFGTGRRVGARRPSSAGSGGWPLAGCRS